MDSRDTVPLMSRAEPTKSEPLLILAFDHRKVLRSLFPQASMTELSDIWSMRNMERRQRVRLVGVACF